MCIAYELSVLMLDIDSLSHKELARNLVRIAEAADHDACVIDAQRIDIEKGRLL